MFNATSIEYAFAHLLEVPIGERGGPNDADVFRAGDPRSLGDLLEKTANHLHERVQRLSFSAEESEPGGPKARLEVAIDSLRDIGKYLREQKHEEPEDYHWEIIGCLAATVAALIDHMDRL